jgi:branched-chain amino acid transport system substrate-binding protein
VGPGRDTGYDAAALISLAMMAAKDYKNGKTIAMAMGRVTDPNGTPITATVEDFKKAVQLLAEGKSVRYVGASGAVHCGFSSPVAATRTGSGNGKGTPV